MKVIILAGGLGTRLGTITQHIPKPMVDIGGRPILWHIMKLYAHQGFNEFVIALGYRGHLIRDFFLNYRQQCCDITVDLSSSETTFHGAGPKEDWKVTLVDTGQTSLKGARIKKLAPYLDDINFMTYGDGLADIDLHALLNAHTHSDNTITVSGVYPPSRFGEIVLNGDKLSRFEEKPQTSSGLINGGFMVFNRELLESLSSNNDCDLEYGAMEALATEGRVGVYQHKGLWACVDHERDLSYLNKLWQTEEAFWKNW